VCCLRQSLQEQVVERLPAAAAARHVEQQRVTEQRRAVRVAAGAVVPVVRALPQVKRQQHLLLLLLLQHAQLIPEHEVKKPIYNTNSDSVRPKLDKLNVAEPPADQCSD